MSKKILLVDDQYRGKTYKSTFEVIGGLEVIWERDMDEVMDLLEVRHEEIGIVLLDVMSSLRLDSNIRKFQEEKRILGNEQGMISGLILLKQLRLITLYDRLKVILFTNRNESAVLKISETIGVKYDGFLSKNENTDSILEYIKKIRNHDKKKS